MGKSELFRVAGLPETHTIMKSMAQVLDFRKACAGVRPSAPVHGLLALPLPEVLLAGLRDAADEAITRFGLHGWLSQEGRTSNAEDPYLSASLAHNPDLNDPGVVDEHQATLGTSNSPRQVFHYGPTQRLTRLKNSYFDTYGFRVLTAAAQVGALGEFLRQCGLSLVRSRISVLRGDHPVVYRFADGWHRDEPVFQTLRVNIPLRSHESYRLQLEPARDWPVPDSSTLIDRHLAPGYAYTWDAHRPHRVFPAARCDVERLHLVLGFAPWFRYDAAQDAWEPNEFYGRVHPFDLMRNGALHPALRAA